MIYVNGDGFAAASYSAVPYSFAAQDLKHKLRGNITHPANFDVSFAKILSNVFHQNLTLNANEHKSNECILREVNQAVDNEKINYLMVTWPNFFRGEKLVNGQMVQFSFRQVHDKLTSTGIKEIIQEYTANWDLDTWLPNWIDQLNALCAKLDARNIKYAFVMSDTLMPKTAHFNQQKWLLNPAEETIVSWASPKALLNGAGYLTPKGHTEFAKLAINYLTTQ